MKDVIRINSNQLYIPPKSMEIPYTWNVQKLNKNMISCSIKNCMAKPLYLSDNVKSNLSNNLNQNHILSKLNVNQSYQSTLELNNISKFDTSNNFPNEFISTDNFCKQNTVRTTSNGKLLIHSETFTKINPYVKKLPLKNIQTEQECKEYKTTEIVHKIINVPFQYKEENKAVKSDTIDKEVDTDDLENFVQQSQVQKLEKQTESVCVSQPEFKSPLTFEEEKNDEEKELVVKEDGASHWQNSQSQNAIDIRQMLNNLLSDLEKDHQYNSRQSGTRSESIDSCSKSSVGDTVATGGFVDQVRSINIAPPEDDDNNNEDIYKLYEDLPRTYNKLCSTALDNNASLFTRKVESSSPNRSCPLINTSHRMSQKKMVHRSSGDSEDSAKHSRSSTFSNTGPVTAMDVIQQQLGQMQTSPLLPKLDHLVSYNSSGLNIRAFSVDPFDELVKSHLSSTDRRLKAISKKVGCTIKVTGPLFAISPRTKVIYHCHLISECRETVDKCLKCLQDSFPLMRLHEIGVSQSLYSSGYHN